MPASPDCRKICSMDRRSLSLDAIVQIFERPAQPAAQSQAHTALAGAHEAHQEYARTPEIRRRLRGLGRPTGSSAHVWRPSAEPSNAAFRQPLTVAWFLALLEVDFTTEGKQPDRRCCLVHRTCEGTPCLDHEGSVFGFQQKIVLHLAPHRAGGHVDRGIVGRAGLDVSAVAGRA